MRNLLLSLAFIFIGINSFSATLWSQDFTAVPANFYANFGMTRNAGSTYSCAFANNVYYTSSSNAYVETNTINVAQGKGIRLSLDSRRVNASAGTIEVYYLVTGACSWDRLNPNNNGWVLWGSITPNTSAAANSGCTAQTLNLESHVAGGQNIAVLLYFPSATSGNWISIDNLVIDDLGLTTVPVPNIVGATSYTENFTTNKWYGPVTTGFNYSTTGIQIPYHSYKSSSSAYTYLWNGGSNGTANHSGVFADYYAAFYTGFEFCGAGASSQIITKELNTSACAAAEIKFAYMAKYPCTAGNYAYTFDESYDLNAPDLYTSIGQGYTWVQQPVNYYFPDGLWHFASYSVPSASNIKIRLSRGGSCSSPVEGVDNLKVFCRNCIISSTVGGAITGEASPAANIDYNYSIDPSPTPLATYYKWMIRDLDATPPVIFEAACPNGTNPCIVSGQGTINVTINFGSNPLNHHFRVMCIPFDAAPGTLAAPSDACYAQISYFPTVLPLPVELNNFKIVDLANNNIQLQWQTLSETNNNYFDIEQSKDGFEFQKIGSLKGGGNSNQLLNYKFNVEHLYFGKNYFRLKQVDFDGKFTYSKILSAINESPQELISISCQNGALSVFSGADVLYPLGFNLYDITGRLVLAEKNILFIAGESKTYSVLQLPKGIYFIQLEGIGVNIKQKILL
ncbi:MAG: T9SS type A sorting domain-containing protein [Bacteroidetes bacterium]|nr:T9SS type A sorting domain-containing protein [Bacteroidota bacterium]